MMNLEALNLAEQKLLSQVGSVTGLMEEKSLQLEQNGTFAEYGKIYEAYVDLIESETEGLEALKRSLFLLWYEQAEPSCFTGVSGLSKTASQKVFSSLERRIETGALDLELQWMLPFYNGITEWVFEPRANLPNLHRFLATVNREIWLQELKGENFLERGQMGYYWTSVSQSNPVRFHTNAS
ncbi:MAG: hypothetical protein LH472_05720 [Pyrinomonadaceae bacterium]|nr:hypothetical protein [Pyrinomonadaceae bacterium]